MVYLRDGLGHCCVRPFSLFAIDSLRVRPAFPFRRERKTFPQELRAAVIWKRARSITR